MRQKALQKWCNYTDWVLHILRAFTNVTLVSEDKFWRLYLSDSGKHIASDSLNDVLPVAMFYYLTTKSCQLS